MLPSTLRLRILAAIGAGGLAVLATEACGASSTPPPTSDAAADGSSAETSVAEAGVQDAAPDASFDAVADRGPASVRRPLLVGASLRAALPASRDDWMGDHGPPAPAALQAATGRALAVAWEMDGCEEHASIAAFARLTLHLLSIGAPPELVEGAQRASLDEVRHARACFALARRYGGAAVGPGPLPLADLFPSSASREVTIEAIAALCAEEGCVGETLGLLLAHDTLARTREPFVRQILATLCEEEAAHVDLAWRVVSFCIAHGGEPVRAAVAEAFRRGIAAAQAIKVRRYDGIDLDAWNAHGRSTCEQARATVARGIREVIVPCSGVLAERRAPRALTPSHLRERTF